MEVGLGLGGVNVGASALMLMRSTFRRRRPEKLTRVGAGLPTVSTPTLVTLNVTEAGTDTVTVCAEAAAGTSADAAISAATPGNIR